MLAAAAVSLFAVRVALRPTGSIHVASKEVVAKPPRTHAGIIMEGVDHALYGYGLYSQMVFGEGFEEPAAPIEQRDRLSEQWGISSGGVNVSLSRQAFSGKQSLRVVGSGSVVNAGLYGLGIAPTAGWSYEGSFYYMLNHERTGSRASFTLQTSVYFAIII